MGNREEILKQLIKQVSNYTPKRLDQMTDKILDEVLLESELDGIHYYLVRCQPRENNPISLSPRERAIAKLVAQGLDNKSIAKTLGITHWTVATYLRRIFSKLDVTSRAAMTARLLEKNPLWE
jgi:two-component system, NarL family, nitrate/nitrite response regulator NarL